MRRYLELFYIGTFIILVGVFFQKIFYGKLPIPTDTLIGLYHPWLDQAAITSPAGVPFKNFLITDPIRQQIPWRRQVISQWQSGQWPSWNPNNFSGAPLLANIQAGVFYPLNILFFVLPFMSAWTTLIVLQPLLGGIFMYIYLRSKKIDPGVSIIGALTWSFCGFSIAWLTWGTILQTALWLPLMLLAIDKHWMLLFVVSSTCAFFAGHAQVALYSFMFAGLYGLLKKSWWMVKAALVIAITSSIQWIPMLRTLGQSSRISDASVWLKDGWFLPWQHVVQFVAPDFFGNPATLNYWGIWNYGEFIGYIGLLPLIFAAYALIFIRDKFVVFCAALLSLVLLFLLPTPIAKIPFLLNIPVFSALQPTRLMVLIDLCLVFLAVFGLDNYIKRPGRKILLPIMLVGLILLALWMYVLYSPVTANLTVSKRNLMLPTGLWAGSSIVILLFLALRRWKLVFLLLVIGIVSFDLFRFGWKFTPFTPASYFFPQTKAISFLQSQKTPFRVMSLDNRALPPNVNAYYGIESIEGYDPIYDSRYEEFMAALNRKEPNSNPPFGFNRIITASTIDSPLLRLMNVKYILALEDIKHDDTELMYREGNTRIYWYKKGMPRVYMVEEVVMKTTKQLVLETLYDKSFRPETTAVVEEPIDLMNIPFGTDEGVELISYSPSQMSMHTRFVNDRFVVIANTYNAGWHASIDDKPTKIYRTNYLFQGVVVPKGTHVVSLYHR